MKIDIVSKEFIKPSSPTPLQLQNFHLSFIDQKIPNTYIPLILYYSFNNNNDHKNDITRSKMSQGLKDSLSCSLVHFYPLAGRILEGQASIICNDEGILYVEAYIDGSISALIERPENDILDRLIPFKSNGAISSCEELLAIQVSFFKCGGVSIGTCISHRICDGATLSLFIKSWAVFSCGVQCDITSPLYNAASLFPPVNRPDFQPNFRTISVQPPISKYVVERLLFTASEIDGLKRRVLKYSSIVKPTRVEVLSGFLWYHCMMAKGIKGPRKSVAFHPVNLRGRNQSLSARSFGNLFQMTKAVATFDDPTDWIELVQKLREGFEKIDTQHIEDLLGPKGYHLAKQNFMDVSKFLSLEDFEVFRFTSHCRFSWHDADFGWGRPVWVSSGGLCIENVVTLFDSVRSGGGIEAWIVMGEVEMKRLRQSLGSSFSC